jgi:hypothetical protein
MKKLEGNVTFHTASSTAFQLRELLGVTDVNFFRGEHSLSIVDSTLA